MDQLTHAWLVGFFSCLMTAFPVAMVMMIPHDGWGRYLPSQAYRDMGSQIDSLRLEVQHLEVELQLAREIIMMKEQEMHGHRVILNRESV